MNIDKHSSKEKFVEELNRIASELTSLSIALYDWVGELNADSEADDPVPPGVPFTG